MHVDRLRQVGGEATSFLPRVASGSQQHFTNFIAPSAKNPELRNQERLFRSNVDRLPRAVGGYGEKDVDMKQMEEKYQRLKKLIQKGDEEEEWRMSEF